MPEFPGGIGVLKSFLANNLNHPIERHGFDGKVYVRFIIDEKGNVIDPVVLKGYSPVIDERALKVVKKLPQWKPGEQDGKKVKVYIIFPIDFMQ